MFFVNQAPKRALLAMVAAAACGAAMAGGAEIAPQRGQHTDRLIIKYKEIADGRQALGAASNAVAQRVARHQRMGQPDMGMQFDNLDRLMQMQGQDPELIREAVWGEVKAHFRPEFLNRIDESVVFHALDEANIKAIARIQLKLLEARLEKMDMKLEVSDEALAEIAKVGFDPVFGARPLKRAIQARIENPVAKLILQGRFGPKDVVPVDVKDGQFEFGRVVH